jgi:hypothetical protein
MSVSMAENGLVAWWIVLPHLMGGTRWYDCVTGSVGTLTGMALPSTSTSGWNMSPRSRGLGELRFDGVDDRVALPTVNPTQITSDITIAFWIKTSGPQSAHIFGSYNTSSPFNGYGVAIGQVLHIGEVSYSGEATWVSGNTTITDSIYHHCAITVLNTSVTFFRDGLNDGSVTSIRPTAYTGAQNICARSDASNFINGVLDDFRIYNRALSTPELKALYESTKRTYGQLESDLFIPNGLPSKQQQADRMLLATM